MEQYLMDKEVLVILDTRKIQRYLFANNAFYDTLGGGPVVLYILDNALKFAVEQTSLQPYEYDLSNDPDAPIPYLDDARVKVQQIACIAGNAFLIVRTGALAQKIIRKVSRYFLDHAYSLNIMATAVEKTDDMREDYKRLYQKLDKIKSSSSIIEPADALPVVVREEKTGLPVIGVDPIFGDYISRATEIRRQTLQSHGITTERDEWNKNFNKENYRAIVHLDGNNFGITIARILQETSGYREGIRTRRQIDVNINALYHDIIDKTIAELKIFYDTYFKGGDFSNEIKMVHNGGDDINYIGNANLMMAFLDLFFKNVEGKYIWNTPTLKVPLYICAGVAFFSKDYDFRSAFRLAEECCKSAKTEAKKPQNLKNGFAGCWIDYQISSNPHAQELSMLRENNYTTEDDIHLALRPYSIDGDNPNDARSFKNFVQRLKNLRRLPNSFSGAKMMRSLYEMGSRQLSQWIRLQKERNLDLKAELGEPLYKDSDGVLHATWFDAAEFVDLIHLVSKE